MASTFSNLGIELIGTGEQAGTWGTTTNGNFSNIIDNAIVGYASVTAVAASTTLGTPALLTVSDGAASSGQKRIIEITSASDLGASSYLSISPNDFAGYYFIKNSLLGSRSLIVFQGTWNGTDPNRAVTIENGYEAVIRCNGAGAAAVVSFINYNIKTGSIYASKTGGTAVLVQAEGEGSTQLRASRSSTDTAQPLVTLTKSRGTIAAKTIVASGDVLGEVSFWGYDGTQIVSAASITSTVDATPGTNDMPGALILGTTADGASAPTERMRISNAGNVGIGTASPTQKLDVNGNVAITGASRRILSDFSAALTGTFFQTSTVNGTTNLGVIPNGTGALSQMLLFSNSDSTNSGALSLYHTAGNGYVQTSANGTGVAGNLYYYPGGTFCAAMNTTGNVGIGVFTPNGKLEVSDPVNRTEATAQFTISGSGYAAAHYLDATGYYIRHNSASRQIRVIANTGGVSLAAAATAWAAISDETQKDIIEPITNAASKLSAVRTVIGKYKTDDEGTRRSFLIAQDIQAVLPEAVDTDADGILSLRYTEMIPLLVAAIKEQQAMIEDLKARVTALGG